MCIFNKEWWTDVGIRAIKTMAETALGLIGTDTIGIMDVNWYGIASACAMAGITTILFNISKIKG